MIRKKMNILGEKIMQKHCQFKIFYYFRAPKREKQFINN